MIDSVDSSLIKNSRLTEHQRLISLLNLKVARPPKLMMLTVLKMRKISHVFEISTRYLKAMERTTLRVRQRVKTSKVRCRKNRESSIRR